jgi:hypothetical protein
LYNFFSPEYFILPCYPVLYSGYSGILLRNIKTNFKQKQKLIIMKFYVLIEIYKNGSGEIVRKSNDKKALLSERENKYTVKQAKQNYYPNYFFTSNVPCSEIQIFKSEKQYLDGKEPVNILYYY